jgi:hypothetical protein
MKYHIERKFRPAAPHSRDTLCGLHVDATTWLCRYDIPIVGVRTSHFYTWINSRRMVDVGEDSVCKTCARIAKGGGA